VECQAQLDTVEEQPSGSRLLTIPVHTRPRFRCCVHLPAEGNWDASLFVLVASMPVDGSSWEQRLPLPEQDALGAREVRLRVVWLYLKTLPRW
jgi:hypothetical protein